MLLFIGRYSNHLKKRGNDFNTSHVTVYRYSWRYKPELVCISIHLMLLFIFSITSSTLSYSSFQYISCYCLSVPTAYRIYMILISIHLMLLFIAYSYNRYSNYRGISIHLMLLFIQFSSYLSSSSYLFQYISCYCLS